MKSSVYLTGKRVQNRHLENLAKSLGARVYDTSHSLVGGLTIGWGFDHDNMSRMKACRREGRPFLFLDHAYFKRGYDNGYARICVNEIHQTGLLDVPGDRLKLFAPEIREWRTGREIIVIVPSEKICEFLGVSKRWAQDTAAELSQYTGRPIRLKHKGPGLAGELKDAHCVVSLASVAEVEAAKMGVPVFATEYSPACQIAEQDFTRIETPIYPDRERWLRTLSYSQWHFGELPEAIKTIRALYGDFQLFGASNSGQ